MTETESSPLPAPDWVLLGFRVPGGVCIYASRKLSRAEVKAKIVEPEILPFQDGICISQARVAYVTMSVEMPEYAMARGADYAEAMRHLMDVWQPEQRTIRLEVTKAAMIPLDDQGQPTGEPQPLPLAGPVDITICPERCPACGSENISRDDLFPERYDCYDCRHEWSHG